jgi:hypothetical protein
MHVYLINHIWIGGSSGIHQIITDLPQLTLLNIGGDTVMVLKISYSPLHNLNFIVIIVCG